MFHVFANTCVLNRTVVTGGEIVMLPRFHAGQVLDALTRSKATALPGVPTMLQALLDHPKLARTDFGALRFCISGGAPLPAELKARFEATTGSAADRGLRPVRDLGGGLVQSLCRAQQARHDRPADRRHARPAGPTRAIRARRRRTVSRAELVVHGPQVMKGYWNRPEADAEVFLEIAGAGHWLRTGDVATIDADGFVRIVDRLKDMIAVGGFKVFPSQVEAALYRHPSVKEALVVGIPDAYHGEMPRAFVTLVDGATETGEQLKAWLNPQLGKHERVDRVVVRESLPKTMIGKLSRKDLLDEIRNRPA